MTKLSSTSTSMLGAAALGLCLLSTACAPSYHVYNHATPPRLAPKQATSIVVEPNTEGRAFEELAIIGVASSNGQRDAALAKEAAALGADAVIDVEVSGKVPVFYLMMIPVAYKTVYAATAIRWAD